MNQQSGSGQEGITQHHILLHAADVSVTGGLLLGGIWYTSVGPENTQVRRTNRHMQGAFFWLTRRQKPNESYPARQVRATDN